MSQDRSRDAAVAAGNPADTPEAAAAQVIQLARARRRAGDAVPPGPGTERPGAYLAGSGRPDAGQPSRAGRAITGLTKDVVVSIVEALVLEGERAGVEDLDRRVATLLAFLRRRLSGDFTVDPFGFDVELTDALMPLLRPLYRRWFRVEVRGLSNVPAEGGALVVANHSGTVPLDSMMTQLAVHDEHPAHRYLRLLGADLVFATPFLGSLARKTGATLATHPDAERLLRAGELVGVWPEGFKGVGKPFAERYKLQRFGRGGFVSAALQVGVPIVPCSIVGAEETYPMVGNFSSLARLLGLPYLPVTPTFPWLGPLGLIPLPSKWIIEFGTPIETESHGRGAADDPMLVFDITDQVRETIQQTLHALLMNRRSVFFS